MYCRRLIGSVSLSWERYPKGDILPLQLRGPVMPMTPRRVGKKTRPEVWPDFRVLFCTGQEHRPGMTYLVMMFCRPASAKVLDDYS
jgi:hypothetical protein